MNYVERIKDRMLTEAQIMLFPNSDHAVMAVPYSRVLEILRYEDLYEKEK